MFKRRILRKYIFLVFLMFMASCFYAQDAMAVGTNAGDSIVNGVDSGAVTTAGNTSAVLAADTFGDIVVMFWSQTIGTDTTLVGGDSATYSATTVLAVYGDTISPDSTSGNGSRGETVDYVLTITNKGNSSDSFRINVSWLTGPDSWSVQFLDLASSNPITDSSTGILAEDAETRVVIRLTISDTSTFGDTTELHVEVWANRGAGGDTGGYTGFTGTLYAGRGNDSTNLITTVFGPAAIRLAKRIFLVEAPSSYGGGAGDVVPGSRITYLIVYDNDGGDSAQGMQLVDFVPANTVFDTAAYLGNAPDSNNRAPGDVKIEYDSGAGFVLSNNPGTDVTRVRWTLLNSVGRDNYGTQVDNASTADEAQAPDFDAGYIKFRVVVN